MEIEQTNIRAAGALYFLWQLEQMRLFDVADKIAELFASGLLPLASPHTGQLISRYYFSKHMRLTSTERSGLYASVFSNREFTKRWADFLAAVVELEMHSTDADSTEAFRKTGYSLALLASAGGGGPASYGIQRLNEHAKQAIEFLKDRSILDAFGAMSMYQVIERVSQTHLGSSVNTARWRSLADAGSRILQFIADHVAFWPPPVRRAIPRVRRPHIPHMMPKADIAEIVKQVKAWLSANGGAAMQARF